MNPITDAPVGTEKAKFVALMSCACCPPLTVTVADPPPSPAAFSGFVGAFSSLYFPLIMKKERVLVGKSLFHNLLLGILGAFAYILFLKLFFLFFYGEAYQQSLQLAYSFSLLVVFIPLRLYIINFFTAHKENVAVIVANIFSNSIALFAFFGFKDFGFEISVLAYMYTLHFSLLFFLGIVYIAPLLKKRIML